MKSATPFLYGLCYNNTVTKSSLRIKIWRVKFMGTLNLAILGAGKIAETMARTIAGLEDVKAYAVASRDLDKAKDFAEKFGFSSVDWHQSVILPTVTRKDQIFSAIVTSG